MENRNGPQMGTPTGQGTAANVTEAARTAILTEGVTYGTLDAEDRERIQKLERYAMEFHQFLSTLGGEQEVKLAQQKIVEATFWGRKVITG